MNKILLVAAIIVLVILLFIKRESYVDFRGTREMVLDIIDEAYENKGFTEDQIEKIKEALEPIMKNDKKLFETLMEYVNQDRFDDVNDLVDLYFSPLYDKKIICYSNGNPLTFFTHSHFGGNDQTTEQESERQ